MKLLTIILAVATPLLAEPGYTPAEELFTLKVKPLLTQKCNACHGNDPEDIDGGLNLLTRESFLKGGESTDDLLVPGDIEKSFLMTVIKWEDPDYEMPPKENDRLTAEQISSFEQWIKAGAPWPDEATQKTIRLAERAKPVTDEGVLISTSGGTSEDWTYRRYQPSEIWAFRPLTQPAPPSGPSHPIDAFVGEKLAEARFQPAPRADLRTLIRRVTYDLTGLPPTPTEVHQFLAAAEENFEKAWSALIDRLLDSPRYGERWAQHWLDVARYADTGGLSNDYERSNAWRYRDYVIRAFNNDKPYNDFIVEQIAGDELADQSLRKRVEDESKYEDLRRKGHYSETEAEQLVASSFLRMGPWDPAMVKAPEARQQYVDDVVNSVGQTFLSTTMRCFKCHDHKFDPLPTRDYYRMYAVFAGTQLAERNVRWLPEESHARFEDEKASVEHLLAFAKKKADALRGKSETAARKWYAENDRPFASLKERKDAPDEEKPPRHVGLDEAEKGRLKVREQDEWIWNRRLERFKPMVQSVYNGKDPGFLNARKLRMPAKINQTWKPDSHILSGGALTAPTDPVTPGVLSSLGIPVPSASEDDPYAIPEELEGRRLALARWIAHPENPLTARSIVNRIWQYHFGRGIAGNSNNFGVKGAPPTHPGLLDWLASDFVAQGWTFKRLHRLILTSETYLRASQHPDQYKLSQDDPDNHLLAYFPTRRQTAEEIRDSVLRITGEFNPDGGGLPIRPEMNLEVALQPRMIQFSIAPTYLPNQKPADRNQRSIYAYRVRGLADPFLETFNQPNPNDSCEERDSAAVSPQAFTLFNSDLMTDRSIALALRLEKEASSLPEQIARGFHLVFQRQPSDLELEKLQAYVHEMKAYHGEVTPGKRAYPSEITRSLVEEFSGKPFTYEEILPVFEHYQADPQAPDVPAETRALADLCLLLFNTHEFIYIY